MEELDGRVSLEGKAEASTAERPGATAATRATAHDQRTAEDQKISAGGGGTCKMNRGSIHWRGKARNVGRNCGHADGGQQRHRGREGGPHDHRWQLEADRDG